MSTFEIMRPAFFSLIRVIVARLPIGHLLRGLPMQITVIQWRKALATHSPSPSSPDIQEFDGGAAPAIADRGTIAQHFFKRVCH